MEELKTKHLQLSPVVRYAKYLWNKAQLSDVYEMKSILICNSSFIAVHLNPVFLGPIGASNTYVYGEFLQQQMMMMIRFILETA